MPSLVERFMKGGLAKGIAFFRTQPDEAIKFIPALCRNTSQIDTQTSSIRRVGR